MISVLLPVKNVEVIIEDCLNGLKWATEVVLIDGASTDNTLDIAARYPNVRVVQHPSKDIRVLVTDGESHATQDWIVWVCADEVFSPELGEEIVRECQAAPTDVHGFILPSRDILFGTEWGEGEDWPRVWRKGTAKFEFKKMHEMPVITGRQIKLKHYYWHINNPNIRTFIPKLLRYETVDAQAASDEECAKINGGFWYQLMRFNYHAIRTYWPNRKRGYSAVAMAFHIGLWQLLRHLLMVEELRIRKGLTKRDTHGW